MDVFRRHPALRTPAAAPLPCPSRSPAHVEPEPALSRKQQHPSAACSTWAMQQRIARRHPPNPSRPSAQELLHPETGMETQEAERRGTHRETAVKEAASANANTAHLGELWQTGTRKRDCRATHWRRNGSYGRAENKMEARTGIEPVHSGFAVRRLTTWLPRLLPKSQPKGWPNFLFMERETGFEPATFCLASRRSTGLSYSRSNCPLFIIPSSASPFNPLLERATGLEPATPGLGSRCSTD